jgi:molybdopterin converting factor small subunit
MPGRKTKYGEPTVSVTVRVPASLYAKIDGAASATIVEALRAHLSQIEDDEYRRSMGQDVKPASTEFIKATNEALKENPLKGTAGDPQIFHSTAIVCPHPKARLRNVARGKRCLDCGAKV